MRSISALRILVPSILCLAFLSPTDCAAAIYTRRDTQGVSHFSNVPLPGWTIFDLGAGHERSSKTVVRAQFSEDPYREIIREWASRYRVEPALVKAMIRAESAFDPRAVSPKGARGLMQLTASTARRHGVSNLHDPHQNIRGGVGHLRGLLDQFHDDVMLAIAAYNAGAGSVVRYGGLPPYRETRSYVAKVLRLRREYLREEKPPFERG